MIIKEEMEYLTKGVDGEERLGRKIRGVGK